MTDKRSNVDVLSLADFQHTLARRLHEAESLVRKLNSEMQCRPPALGTFADAKGKEKQYNTLLKEYADRVERLKSAIVAAQKATKTIITNYTTTEARNRASASDIAAAMTGVGTALDEDGHV